MLDTLFQLESFYISLFGEGCARCACGWNWGLGTNQAIFTYWAILPGFFWSIRIKAKRQSDVWEAAILPDILYK